MSFYTAIAVASQQSADRPLAHRLLPGSGFVVVEETKNADGTYADTWAKGLARVSVAGMPALVVSITADGVAVSPAPMNKSEPNAGVLAAQAYRQAGRSVVKDAIAVGVSPADAERLFGGDRNTSSLKALSSAGA